MKTLSLARRGSLVLAAGCCLVGCSRGPVASLTVSAVAPAPAAFDPASDIRAIELSSGELTATAGEVEASSLNTGGNVSIRVTTLDGADAVIGGVSVPSSQWTTLPVARLDKGTTVAIAAGSGTPYQLATLPADFPDYTVSASSPARGRILMAANATDGSLPPYLLMTDEQGQPLYYKKLAAKAFNFQRHAAPDGGVRYSYIQQDGDQLAGVNAPQGTIHLLDANFQELARPGLLATDAHGALPADVHEYVYLGDSHYIAISAVREQVSPTPGTTCMVAASIIQEVQDGEVLFDWDSTRYPEFFANASDGNDYATATTADYMHMNAVCVDPADGNLVVSFRHQDQVVKLDRKTGAILWRLGGKDSDFPLTAEQRFSHQHFARMNADGTLTLFDNGNASGHTRLLTFKLDEAARAVTAFSAMAPDGRYSSAMGDFQPLAPDTFFVGWGAKNAGSPDASELGADGSSRFTLTFTDPLYTSYRALKYLD